MNKIAMMALLMLSPLVGRAQVAGSLAQGFSLSGNLTDLNGVTIANTSPSFIIQIWDMAVTCKMYEETQTVSIDPTTGAFSIIVGSQTGDAKRTANDPGWKLSQIFQNTTSLAAAGAGCPSGHSATPFESRKIRVFVDGTQLSDITMNVMATATVAETVGGKKSDELLNVRVDGSYNLSQSAVENIFSNTNYPILTSLLAGTGNYMPSTPTSAVGFNNQRIINVAAPTAGTDATNKTYVDNTVGGLAASITGVSNVAGNGLTLVWNQTNNRWEAGAPTSTDNTKLPLAGGNMSGPINMNGNGLRNVGTVGIGISIPVTGAIAEFVGVGAAYSSIVVPRDTTANRPTTPANGMIRYNTTLAKLEAYENGGWQNMIAAGSGGDFMANGSVPMTGQLLATSGSAASPSISFTGDSGTGLYSAAYQNVSLSTGGVERLRVSASGYVGVGLTSPGARLDVNGNLILRPSGISPGQSGLIALQELSANGTDLYTIRAPDSMVGGMGWTLPAVSPTTGQILSSDSMGNLSWINAPVGDFRANGSVAMTGALQMNGNPIFGSSGSAGSLTLDSTSSGTKGNIYLNPAGGSVAIGTSSSNVPFQVTRATGPTQVMFSAGASSRSDLLLTGPVGSSYPGVSLSYNDLTSSFELTKVTNGSPDTTYQWMNINGSAGTFKFYAVNGGPTEPRMSLIRSNNLSTVTSGTALGSIWFDGYNGGAFSSASAGIRGVAMENFTASAQGSSLNFYTTPAGTAASQSRMTLDAAGNLGIGTSTPAAKMHVVGSGNLLKLQSTNPIATMIMSYSPNQSSITAVDASSVASLQFDAGNDSYAELVLQAGSGQPGRVGVGVAFPQATLHVAGAIISGYQSTTGATADFSLGNVIDLSSVGGSTISLLNLVPGGVYRVVVSDTTSRTYTFSGCTTYFSPANGATTYRSIYTITYAGGACYVDWKTGYN